MRTRFLQLAIALCAFAPASSVAQGPLRCFDGASRASRACFAQAVIDALHAAHIASLTPLDTVGQSQSPVSVGSAVLYQSSQQRSGMERGLEVLRPWASSPDSAVRSAALEVAQGLLELRRVSFIGDSILHDALDGLNGRTSQQAQRLADWQTSRHKAATFLMLTVIGVTYALVEADPSTPSRTRLNITAAERTALLRHLESSFGADLVADSRTGRWRTDFASAVQSLGVFLRQDWATRP